MTCGPLCGQLWLETGEYLVVPGEAETICSVCPKRFKAEEEQQDLFGGSDDVQG